MPGFYAGAPNDRCAFKLSFAGSVPCVYLQSDPGTRCRERESPFLARCCHSALSDLLANLIQAGGPRTAQDTAALNGFDFGSLKDPVEAPELRAHPLVYADA